MKPHQLMDMTFYGRQAKIAFENQEAAYSHFCEAGQEQCLDPSPFFATSWYIWQNPGSCGESSVIEHFLKFGQYGDIDPSPIINSKQFLQENPRYDNMAEALLAMTTGEESAVSPILEDHLEKLSTRQKAVLAKTKAHFIRHVRTTRPNLVFIQAGPRFSLARWFRPELPRSWDLCCNWYSLNGPDLTRGEIHISQPGTKSTAIYNLLTHHPEFLLGYEDILFLDDDIIIRHEDIDNLFCLAKKWNLDLFQPALLPGSNGAWADLFQRKNSEIRYVTGVEIMMPGFNKDALRRCTHIFGRNVSGYGLDFLLSEHIRASGGKCAVIDAVGARHEMPIDENDGSYYRLMRSLGINHKLELFAAIRELGAFPTFRTMAI